MREFYRYVRVDGKPVGTLVAVVEEGMAPKFGVAVCSDKDQFSRKIGRELALKNAIAEREVYTVPKKYVQPILDELHLFAGQVFSRNSDVIGNIPHINYQKSAKNYWDKDALALTLLLLGNADQSTPLGVMRSGQLTGTL